MFNALNVRKVANPKCEYFGSGAFGQWICTYGSKNKRCSLHTEGARSDQETYHMVVKTDLLEACCGGLSFLDAASCSFFFQQPLYACSYVSDLLVDRKSVV